MRRSAHVLAAMAIATIAAGCSTVRYTARVVDTEYRRGETKPLGNIYRIHNYKWTGDGSYVYRTACHVSKVAISNALARCLGDTAKQKTVSVPVELRVSKISDRLSDEGSFLNAITFGLLPFTAVQETTVRISAAPVDERVAFRVHEFDVKLEHKSRFTPFFGIWPYLREDDGVFCVTHFGGSHVNCLAIRDVYLQAIGRGLADLLARVDEDVTMQGTTFLANESDKKRENAMKPEETVEDRVAKRNKDMRDAKCPVCKSDRNADGSCPICVN